MRIKKPPNISQSDRKRDATHQELDAVAPLRSVRCISIRNFNLDTFGKRYFMTVLEII